MKTIKVVLEVSISNTLSEKNAVWLIDEHFRRHSLKDYYASGPIKLKNPDKIHFKRVLSFEKACTAEIIKRTKEEKERLKKLMEKLSFKLDEIFKSE